MALTSVRRRLARRPMPRPWRAGRRARRLTCVERRRTRRGPVGGFRDRGGRPGSLGNGGCRTIRTCSPPISPRSKAAAVRGNTGANTSPVAARRVANRSASAIRRRAAPLLTCNRPDKTSACEVPPSSTGEAWVITAGTNPSPAAQSRRCTTLTGPTPPTPQKRSTHRSHQHRRHQPQPPTPQSNTCSDANPAHRHPAMP